MTTIYSGRRKARFQGCYNVWGHTIWKKWKVYHATALIIVGRVYPYNGSPTHEIIIKNMAVYEYP